MAAIERDTKGAKVGLEGVYIDELASRALGNPPTPDLPRFRAARAPRGRPTFSQLVKRLVPRPVKRIVLGEIERVTTPVVHQTVAAHVATVAAHVATFDQSHRRLHAAVASLDVVVEDLREEILQLQERLAQVEALEAAREAVDASVTTRDRS